MTIKCYQVGGYVRDRLMGLRSKDLDVVVEAPDYPTMLRWIQSQGGRIYLEQPEFWTVRAHLPGQIPTDYVLARMDGQYGDGRRPDSVNAGTLLDDLARRDFTVNAIAFDVQEDLYIDPHGGRQDIADKLLRCVGDPKERFFEDALRMLRALRFAITKGFAIHASMDEALRNPLLTERLMDNVSEERKREELHKCFAYNSLLTLDLLGEYKGVRNACFSDRLWLMPTCRLA